ncbi:uncharacterized protein CLUP02_01511 [Colletotrichum lupini]|uniref:Uncharacterized protein n=1 Tax=Colletotrichum lupini TaxID=145971 RepID=A0A9Q8W990_9PEZI|nr:uncharacterized protein CLUP02_01511 [Colletotrichum lupini]UQC74859.1 hypothetical protein CLUP02_01511 [Colletotrichum lupini]
MLPEANSETNKIMPWNKLSVCRRMFGGVCCDGPSPHNLAAANYILFGWTFDYAILKERCLNARDQQARNPMDETGNGQEIRRLVDQAPVTCCGLSNKQTTGADYENNYHKAPPTKKDAIAEDPGKLMRVSFVALTAAYQCLEPQRYDLCSGDECGIPVLRLMTGYDGTGAAAMNKRHGNIDGKGSAVPVIVLLVRYRSNTTG